MQPNSYVMGCWFSDVRMRADVDGAHALGFDFSCKGQIEVYDSLRM